jgi:hypothetical protein
MVPGMEEHHDPKFTNDPGAEGISREAAGPTRQLFADLW